MSAIPKSIAILVADDDEESWMLTREALAEAYADVTACFVADGEELLDFLNHQGRYVLGQADPAPDLILLDLKMPRKDGFETLQELQTDGQLQRIPVVVLSTSQADEDLRRAFDLGVCIFITKPASFEGLVNVLRVLSRVCFGTDGRPRGPGAERADL
jgi:CheY-like chemotaxis protein